jgi:hypothetical protein
MSFTLTRVRNSAIHFEQIDIGNGMIASIQASAFHYCTPRIDNLSSDEYTHFEVALLLDGDWFHPERDTRFMEYEWASYWNEHDAVAANVPRESIEQMLIDLWQAFSN